MTFERIIAALREKYPQLVIMDFGTLTAIIKPSIDWLVCIEYNAAGQTDYTFSKNEDVCTDEQVGRLISQLQLLRQVAAFMQSLRPMPLPVCYTYEEFADLVDKLGKRIAKPGGGGWTINHNENIIKPQFDRWVTAQHGCESSEAIEDEWNCYGIKGPLREAVVDIYAFLRSDYDGVELDDLTLRRH